jgi:hypothetical protein
MSYDEELQKKIEAHPEAAGDDPDAQAYREVFRALNRTRGTSFSPGFADNVMAHIEASRRRTALRDLLWLGLGIFLIVIAFVVAIVFTGFRLELGFLKSISAYGGVFAFGAAFILLLHWLDKQLVTRKSPEI